MNRSTRGYLQEAMSLDAIEFPDDLLKAPELNIERPCWLQSFYLATVFC